MCTGDLVARVSCARLPYAKNLVSGAGLAYKGPGVIRVRALKVAALRRLKVAALAMLDMATMVHYTAVAL